MGCCGSSGFVNSRQEIYNEFILQNTINLSSLNIIVSLYRFQLNTGSKHLIKQICASFLFTFSAMSQLFSNQGCSCNRLTYGYISIHHRLFLTSSDTDSNCPPTQVISGLIRHFQRTVLVRTDSLILHLFRRQIQVRVV